MFGIGQTTCTIPFTIPQAMIDEAVQLFKRRGERVKVSVALREGGIDVAMSTGAGYAVTATATRMRGNPTAAGAVALAPEFIDGEALLDFPTASLAHGVWWFDMVITLPSGEFAYSREYQLTVGRGNTAIPT